MVTKNNKNEQRVIVKDAGIVDYKKGEVILNTINITSGKIKDGQTIIEVQASPYSNDVIGLQDLYLQLDISNSTFETVVDEVASGLDPSGSNYIVTSSYPNGTLVRSGGRNVSTTPGTTQYAVSSVDGKTVVTTY